MQKKRPMPPERRRKIAQPRPGNRPRPVTELNLYKGKKRPVQPRVRRVRKRKRITWQEKRRRIRKKRIKLVITFLLGLVFFCCLIIGILFFFRFQTYVVTGAAMEPTFQKKDRIFIYNKANLNRYDIVCFPVSEDIDKEKSTVRRIIGIPGDKIYVQENRLFLWRKESQEITREEMTYSMKLSDSTIVIELTEKGTELLRGMNEIPKNKYFVMGDNRKLVEDSRAFGFISKEEIEGVVLTRPHSVKE